ncbi:hypothetical protein FMM54_01475 [Campylobacter sp. LR185c]|uniref:flagellar FLiS export co-chaperone n=1 Tax=Campylobacter sp. LR185c TaxID=2014525 RepID=UPI001237FB5E|nr:flagellar FLiS export co-chaperone [Campylobacter sp. LR185c]KAA6227830.1 hypothetical protein FMM54_01475 [Campylobacter sp. LR185c]KAA8604483.1 hypothetical protein CGP82_02880 [Campylobacter sp. LR185c]
MNELDVLKKHLGDVDNMGVFKAKQICSQISDANDFIGALQVLDIALKKIHTSLSQRIDESLDDMQKRTLDADASSIIQNCSFMGTALFDNVFSVYVRKQNFEFEIANPLLVLEKSDYNGVLAYIEDKREEISNILVDVTMAITLGLDFSNAGVFEEKQTQKFDLKNIFATK